MNKYDLVKKGKKILIGAAAVITMFGTMAIPAFASTKLVSNLQPDWTAVGGGGVYSAYYGPSTPTYDPVSPGVTAIYLGRQAGPIFAGVTIDPVSLVYEDQGLFAFKPGDTPVAKFAKQDLTYDFVNQYGTAPVWVYIELNKGIAGDMMYQYVPTSNPPNWHTENAAKGKHWQAWTDTFSGITTGPMVSLEDIAVANPGKTVSRVYLTEGMGDSYHSTPNGTFAWVDKVRIGETTYDFVVASNHSGENNHEDDKVCVKGWNVSGAYTFDVKYLGNDYNYSVILSQSGKTITGSLNDPFLPGTLTISNGSLIGNTITFSVDYGSGSWQGIRTFTGTIDLSGNLSGTWNETGLENGFDNWTATLGKATQARGECNDNDRDKEKDKEKGKDKEKEHNNSVRYYKNTHRDRFGHGIAD